MVSLKNLLQAGPVDMAVDYVSPLMAHKKKDGGSWMAHDVKLRTESNGEVYDGTFFENHVFKVGDLVRASLNDKGYPRYAKVGSGEPRSNTQEVKKERNMAASRETMEKQQKIKEKMISLAGLTQAHISAGRTNAQAVDLAKEAHLMILEAAILLAE